MKKKITMAVTVDASDIADEMDRDDLIDFIKTIDESVADWDFTILLADYFDEQRKLYEHELADADASAREYAIRICSVAAARPGFLVEFGFDQIADEIGASPEARRLAHAAFGQSGCSAAAAANLLRHTGWRPA